MKWALLIAGLAGVAWLFLRRQGGVGTAQASGGLDSLISDPEYQRAVSSLKPDEVGKLTRENREIYGGSPFTKVPAPVTQSTAPIWKPGNTWSRAPVPPGIAPGWNPVPGVTVPPGVKAPEAPPAYVYTPEPPVTVYG